MSESPREVGMETWEKLGDETGSDVFLHSGDLMPPADDLMIALARRPRRPRAYLFVTTFGGYARSAYRMMRCLRHAYEHVTLFVSGPCKSAGTLVVIGGDELVMTGAGELGPLDVQILKDNELQARQSGLTPTYSFSALTLEARTAFAKAFVEMKLHGRLTTTTAADTAAQLTIGLMAPIFAQIDPIRVGEISMAHLVANRYAEALTWHEGKARSNVLPGAIGRLLGGYPSHDYAIDRQEAKELFKIVRHPTESELAVHETLESLLSTPSKTATTIRLTPPKERTDAQQPTPARTPVADPAAADPDDGTAGSRPSAGTSPPRARRGGRRTRTSRAGAVQPADDLKKE